jgi:hypothetical protein
MSWQGEHNRLNTCSPAAASCANAVPVEAATTIPAITNVLIVFLLFRIPIDARPGAGLGSTRKPAPHKRASRLEPTCDRNLHAVRMALSVGSVNGPKGESVPLP